MIDWPLVAISCNRRIIEDITVDVCNTMNTGAVRRAAHGVPLLIPSMADEVSVEALLENVDGLMLTGSRSNVHPDAYASRHEIDTAPHDRDRDATVFRLIPAALEAGLPLLAICRGFQELNVALGGSLHPRVHEIDGRMDHRSSDDDPLHIQFGPRHEVALTPGGRLGAVLGAARITVNSLHWQGIERKAEGLSIEATADDGTIEAVSVTGARGFAMGVQWHPEWRAEEIEHHRRLFEAFGAACRERREARLGRRAVALPRAAG